MGGWKSIAANYGGHFVRTPASIFEPMATKKKSLDWALSPAPESKDHVKINEQYELFIGGKWQKPKSGMTSR